MAIKSRATSDKTTHLCLSLYLTRIPLPLDRPSNDMCSRTLLSHPLRLETTLQTSLPRPLGTWKRLGALVARRRYTTALFMIPFGRDCWSRGGKSEHEWWSERVGESSLWSRDSKCQRRHCRDARLGWTRRCRRWVSSEGVEKKSLQRGTLVATVDAPCEESRQGRARHADDGGRCLLPDASSTAVVNRHSAEKKNRSG
ncbi:hypothetical protein BDY19DRAFT_461172 [Irpex rosettiformis]|uniref:Uncharacterized protein n=1 Tax=Irpex rosettiformis TaxID=378272 RepID=A0ACB8TSJ0_9APHY|nr:hypothetical protein BDY19DRAFT_461172 [Irpex rosettiformis]